MSEPAQKPGQSEQTVGTPPEFIDAVERRFGPITFDLAATKTNRVRQVPWYGPGSPDGENALVKPWNQLPSGLLWLNPPFEDIAPWARKCRMMGEHGARIAFLVPLSSGNWARDHVHGHGQVEALNPRLRFIGHKSLYPKDLMLVLHGPGFTVGFNVWRWK